MVRKFLIKIPLSIRIWIVISVVICAFSLLAYSTSQQVLRQGANDPQIQIAEDIKSQIDSGKDVKKILNPTVDPRSLNPFVVVYDKDLNIVASGAKLDAIPNPPKGVFEFVKVSKTEIFTWEPRDDIRIASYMMYDDKTQQFILAGRNFWQIEEREHRMFLISAFTWFAAEITTLLVSLFLF